MINYLESQLLGEEMGGSIWTRWLDLRRLQFLRQLLILPNVYGQPVILVMSSLL